MGKSSPAVTTENRTSVNTPWAPAVPALTNMVNAAGSAYAATPKTGTYVDPNADQQAAWAGVEAAAPGMNTGVDALRGLATDEISGKYLDPSTNPYIAAAYRAAINPLENDLQHKIVTLGDAAQMGGAFGGDRQQLLAGQAIGDFNQTAANIGSTMYENNYNTERQIQQNAGGLLTTANQLALAPSTALDAIGQEQQSQAEAKLASAIDAPWAGLDRYSQVLSTLAPYASNATNGTSTQTGGQPSGAASFLQGAMGGASTGFTMGGPWGAAIGGGIGGLAGLFGG